MRRILSVGLLVVVATVLPASPSSATIHPLVQSIYCAADAARAHTAVGDPVGQTPSELTVEEFSISGNLLTVSFGGPITFDQSDFRAMIATGFVDEVVTDSEGDVVALIVDLTSIPQAVSGRGGLHCA